MSEFNLITFVMTNEYYSQYSDVETFCTSYETIAYAGIYCNQFNKAIHYIHPINEHQFNIWEGEKYDLRVK